MTDEPRATWPVPRDFTAREQAEEDALPPEVRAAYEALATHELAGSAE